MVGERVKLYNGKGERGGGGGGVGVGGGGWAGSRAKELLYYTTILPLFTSPSGDSCIVFSFSGSFLTVNTVIFVYRDNEPLRALIAVTKFSS